jgi:hypothetical protein
VQVDAGEGTLKGAGGLLVVILEGEQTLLEFSARGEVIGSEDLTLNDGEIDLDLIEPAGMDRGVNEHDRGPRGAQAVGSFVAAVGGTVVGNPKDPPRGAIGFYRMTCSTGRSNGWMPVVFSQRPKSLRDGHPRRQCTRRRRRAGTRARCGVQRPGAGWREGWMRMRVWMLVFSSAESTKSRRPSGAPLQQPWLEVNRPALAAKLGSRGKIQLRYRHGHSASRLNQRHRVEPLTWATIPSATTSR